jgi:hypothetical protein
MKEIDYIVFNFDWYDSLQELEPIDKVKILDCIFAYARHQQLPELPYYLRAIFSVLKSQIDKNVETAEQYVKSRRENGAKGGRPAKRDVYRKSAVEKLEKNQKEPTLTYANLDKPTLTYANLDKPTLTDRFLHINSDDAQRVTKVFQSINISSENSTDAQIFNFEPSEDLQQVFLPQNFVNDSVILLLQGISASTELPAQINGSEQNSAAQPFDILIVNKEIYKNLNFHLNNNKNSSEFFNEVLACVCACALLLLLLSIYYIYYYILYYYYYLKKEKEKKEKKEKDKKQNCENSTSAVQDLQPLEVEVVAVEQLAQKQEKKIEQEQLKIAAFALDTQVVATQPKTEQYLPTTQQAYDDFLSDFFSERNAIKVEQFCMSEHIMPAELRDIAQQVVNDWMLTERQHRTGQELRCHFLNTCRKKIDIQRKRKRNPTLEEKRQELIDGQIRDLQAIAAEKGSALYSETLEDKIRIINELKQKKKNGEKVDFYLGMYEDEVYRLTGDRSWLAED